MYKFDCFQDYRKLAHLLAPLLFLDPNVKILSTL